VIVAEDQVVGFFLIDTVYDQSIGLTTKQNMTKKNLGLRKFFIDSKHQGNGYAKQTLQALPAYLQSEFPNYTDLYLTVNCKNDAAKILYLSHGFEDTNELYLEGPSGPQHIMGMDLVKN
jgi:RimJ/RimL family protein N-acetyltransferase